MRIGITDSGVGGLSVCAEVEARLRNAPVENDVELVYLNAALRDDYSYNAMASRQQKLETFDRFLENATERYAPDLLYIACNSLSVLFQDPSFERHNRIPIIGIVETGTEALVSALKRDEDSVAVVFATPTTVEEGTYLRNLAGAGVESERIVQQACPGLPDAISNDFTGQQARQVLGPFIPAALEQFGTHPGRVVAFLGCTHYGYQAAVFQELLSERIADVTVLNPNRSAAESIVNRMACKPGSTVPRVRFVTPYPIPQKPMASLPHYIGDTAPATVAALRGFTHDPALYRET